MPPASGPIPETPASAFGKKKIFFGTLAAVLVIIVGLLLYYFLPHSDQTTQAQQDQQGKAPTAEEDAHCMSQYAQTVDTAAQQYVQPGVTVSKGLFFSPSLNICVGVVEMVQGNDTNFETFDPATGDTLDPSDNATAFADWSLDTSSASSTSQ